MAPREQTPLPLVSDTPPLTLRPVLATDWPLIVELFGDNGACGGCWCMWWRVPRGGKLWQEARGSKNRNAFRKLLQAGQVRGVAALAEGTPVGWCSFGPRSAFPRLERVRALQRDWSAGTWSVNCFFIPARWRGRGVATQLLRKATDEAFSLGASEIEGYPVVPREPPVRVPAAFAWTGVPALFTKAGYRELPHAEGTRPIYLRTRGEDR